MKQITVVLALGLVLLLPRDSFCQWTVFDPVAAIHAATAITAVQNQLQLWNEIRQGLANVDSFRLSPLDVPLLMPRAIGAPVLYGEDVPDVALADTDSRLDAAIQNASRVAQFSQAVAGRIRALESAVTSPTRTLQGAADASAAGLLLIAQQNDARQHIEAQRLDLELQRALAERNDRATQAQQRVNLKNKPRVDLGAQRLGTDWLP